MSITVLADGTRIQDCLVRNLQAGDVLHPTLRTVKGVYRAPSMPARQREVILQRPGQATHTSCSWNANTVVSILERRSIS